MIRYGMRSGSDGPVQTVKLCLQRSRGGDEVWISYLCGPEGPGTVRFLHVAALSVV